MRLSPDHVLVPVELRSLGVVGTGMFLRAPVERGTTMVIIGGRATPGNEFRRLPEYQQHRSLQVADDVYLVTDPNPTLGDYINHSCDPTTVFVGEITLVARRDLAVGEQVTMDYATCDSSPYDEFECECGSAACRGKVTGEDWMKPELHERYAGQFSPYLQRKIDALPN